MTKKKVVKRRVSKKRVIARDAHRVLNCSPSINVHEDWSYETALEAGITAAKTLPSSVDLREEWWKVRDQGSTGSCVGMATADSVLYWHFVKANRLSPDEILSPRFTWMASKETDIFVRRPTTFIESSGTSLKAALDISRDFGAVHDSVLPFETDQLYQGRADVFYATASKLKIDNYTNLGTNSNQWKNWLAFEGPILTRLNVDHTWMTATDSNGRLTNYKPATATGGHAVAIVGYTPRSFIVRNSWGESWGRDGFAFASLKYARDAFTEAYGVTVKS